MPDGLWPWLAVAGAGALHGLNPATGWALAAACALRTGDRSESRRALRPIAIGHVASVGLVAAAVAAGVSLDRGAVQVLAGALLIAVLACHLVRLRAQRTGAPTKRAGLALWSFMVSSAHGAGLMLVPALIPLCVGDPAGHPVGVPGSLLVACAAVCVHAAAMLAVTGVVAIGVCRGWALAAPRLSRQRRRHDRSAVEKALCRA